MLDEIYYLVKFAAFSHNDILTMPVYERRYYVGKLTEEYQKKQELINQAKNKSRA